MQVSSQISPTRSLLRLGSAEPSGPATSLYLWPFAGGTAHFYQNWGLRKLEDISSYAIELPGRGLRLREAPIPEMSKMVEDALSSVVPVLERPFAFFGHSMGALLAFEVTRRLREMGLPLPCHLFVSACRAPHLAARNRPWHPLPEDELIA
ncbi:MAG: alpha/beta fold hydrolase, partial [Albidovulum sp.]|uniref:thioesterase II family protein n=1 Tax=Albidovulum sp. TaxID=1872424 RepID=UPI003CAAB5F2